jgi:hypothetical protein
MRSGRALDARLRAATGILAGVILGLTAEGVAAATITLSNPSFEDPDVTDGQMLGALNPDATTVPGWGSSFSGIGLTGGGVHDPVDAQYPGATGDGAPLPGTADGGQALFLQGTLAGNTQSFATATSVATVADQTTYTLTAAVGNPLDGDPGDVAVQILVSGLVVAEATADATGLPDGTFTDLVAVFTAGVGDPLTGGTLKVRLFQTVNANALQIAHFDRVTLEDSTVPEPAGAALLAAGAAVLAAFGNRRAWAGLGRNG